MIHIDHSCVIAHEDDFSEISNSLQQMYRELEKDREKFNNEKELNRNIYESDVIHLNVGGEIIATTRKTLISLRKSLFSILFNGRWEQRLHYDDHENIFLDFDPIVFRHLLDQLQLNEGENISPPSDPSLSRSFEKMMRKLRVGHLLSTSNSNILTVNVDGQSITTHSSNPFKLMNKTHVFIDYHPQIFRHFIKINRQNKSLSIHKQMFDINFNQQIIQTNQSFAKNFNKLRKFFLSF